MKALKNLKRHFFLPDVLIKETPAGPAQTIWLSKLQWLTPERYLSLSQQKVWLKVTILIHWQSAK